MKTSLENVKRKYKEGKYREALSILERIEQEGLLHPDVFVWKGRCLQLDDGEASSQLSDVENAFKQALNIDSDFIPAILELAWFYLNVLDDANRAIEHFDKAIHLCRDTLAEAVIGKAKCLYETETKDAVLNYIAEITNTPLDLGELHKLRKEIESFHSLRDRIKSCGNEMSQ